MRIEDIDIDLIDMTKDRRVVDPNWAETLAGDFARIGQKEEIEVVEAGGRYRLIDGAQRIAARRLRGEMFIPAKIKTVTEVATEADMTLREIAANFMRRENSVLDKARDVARWRAAYEQAAGAVKPGKKSIRGKSAPNSDEALDAQAELFAATFTEAAQSALGMNKDAIKRSLRIARIDDAVRIRISLHPIADNQSELLLLCSEPAERQAAIAGLLLSEPPAAHKIADAIALLDRLPATAKPEAWERLSDQFNKLPDAAKRRFIAENWGLIEEHIAAKTSGASGAERKAA